MGTDDFYRQFKAMCFLLKFFCGGRGEGACPLLLFFFFFFLLVRCAHGDDGGGALVVRLGVVEGEGRRRVEAMAPIGARAVHVEAVACGLEEDRAVHEQASEFEAEADGQLGVDAMAPDVDDEDRAEGAAVDAV